VYCCETDLQSAIPRTGNIKTGTKAVMAKFTASVNHQVHIQTAMPAIKLML